MSARATIRAAIACLVAGSLIMLAFESALARVAGVVLLVAFIVLGTLAIATPEYLGDRDGDEDW